MKLWPIYVPSRGRAQLSKLLLAASDLLEIDLTVVVEPQEEAAYRAAFPSLEISVLPGSNRGIAYARNHVLDLSEAAGHDWFWMIDDDVSRFYRVANKKCVPADMVEVLLEAQEQAKDNIGQIALEYQQFAWSSNGKAKLNSYCDVCVAVRVATAPTYRENTKEDRDFTMQIIASGLDTVRISHLAFGAPANGSNQGGLFEDYASGKEPGWAKTLVEQWPWCCEMQKKPSGRIDAKIHWKKIRSR